MTIPLQATTTRDAAAPPAREPLYQRLLDAARDRHITPPITRKDTVAWNGCSPGNDGHTDGHPQRVTIEAAAYPHLIDNIIRYCDRQTLWSIAATSRQGLWSALRHVAQHVTLTDLQPSREERFRAGPRACGVEVWSLLGLLVITLETDKGTKHAFHWTVPATTNPGDTANWSETLLLFLLTHTKIVDLEGHFGTTWNWVRKRPVAFPAMLAVALSGVHTARLFLEAGQLLHECPLNTKTLVVFTAAYPQRQLAQGLTDIVPDQVETLVLTHVFHDWSVFTQGHIRRFPYSVSLTLKRVVIVLNIRETMDRLSHHPGLFAPQRQQFGVLQGIVSEMQLCLPHIAHTIVVPVTIHPNLLCQRAPASFGEVRQRFYIQLAAQRQISMRAAVSVVRLLSMDEYRSETSAQDFEIETNPETVDRLWM
ncbi:uncharacterized protein EHS24_001655 [Apiotrichum porosum]|uniref:Uncharacterized protein n=1 Tax=Apiotrichum porosum TaxID=105984 RepID=A0A427XIQ7_9TREE|nr:uncharacterized protein EHS24_001655 [Apiotrichum porosum]RSH78750.1 hypothetical protein EHS24_001655 [Apiotrichum porosum]